jgi:hypothetical protein
LYARIFFVTYYRIISATEKKSVHPVGVRRNITAAMAIFQAAQNWELMHLTVTDFGFSPHSTAGIVS